MSSVRVTDSRTDSRNDRERSSPSRRPLGSRIAAGHVLVVVAGVLAAVTNFAVLRAADDTVRVAVAARDIRPGQRVTADVFALADVRADRATLDGLLGPDDLRRVAGHVAADRVASGELVQRSDLRPPAAPQRHRAMSIPFDPARAVGGRLVVGDRVDAIAVDDGTAQYVAVAVPVLDVSTPSAAGALGGLGAASITVAVDATTALELARAIDAGLLQLVRSTGAPQALRPDQTGPRTRRNPGGDGGT